VSEGIGGHPLLGHPDIVELLLASIHEITGIKIKVPSRGPYFLSVWKWLKTRWHVITKK